MHFLKLGLICLCSGSSTKGALTPSHFFHAQARLSPDCLTSVSDLYYAPAQYTSLLLVRLVGDVLQQGKNWDITVFVNILT